MTRASVLWLAGLLLALGSPVTAAESPTSSGSPDSGAAGLHGYVVWCAPCHGIDGRGEGPWARNLPGRPPRDFTRGLFEHRGTVDRARPEDVAQTILHGVPGTEMPSFRGLLNHRQALAVAEVVLAMSPRAEEEPAGEDLVIPPETPDTPESRARGLEIYMDDCAGCHGPEGRGNGKRAGDLKDAWGRPIRPRDLVYAPIEAGEDALAMYVVLSSGMEGVPMPPEDLFLEPEEIWDLVHYVRSLRKERTAMWRFLKGDPLDPTQRR